MKYEFIGHCYDKAKNHDKVWVCIPLEEGKYLAAYGRRTKTLRPKLYNLNSYEMRKIINRKINSRGYNSVDETKLTEIYPEFEEDLEATTMWSALGGCFHA